jgi:hypothetical protein
VCCLCRYIWAYWISPFAYLLRAVVINEMTSPAWRTPLVTPSGTTTVGDVSLLITEEQLSITFDTGVHVSANILL